MIVRPAISLILLLPLAAAPTAQIGAVRADEDALVKAALANEAQGAVDAQHPMRYRLRKSSPRLTSTKDIFETKDGAVARLVAINDSPLSAADAQREETRLNGLLSDPGKQRHRKQAEEEDAARAMRVLRALPVAFLYEYAGVGDGPAGKVDKFSFKPNPKFNPPDLETQVLTEMAGEIWIDPAQQRITRLEGHLQQDVDFGWGILGRLNKGGWIVIEQADIGDHQWRIVHFKMSMSGRVVFRTKVFDTTEDESHFEPVPVGLRYQKAIEMLRDQSSKSTPGTEASNKN